MNRVDVLDHGYCEPVEFWGSDERVIESARMSTGKGFNGWGPRCKDCGAGFDAQVGVCDLHVSFGGHSRCTGTEKVAGDEKLLRYLWENKHSTPFEMAGATFEIRQYAVVIASQLAQKFPRTLALFAEGCAA